MCVALAATLALANAFSGAAYYYGFDASVGALKRLDGVAAIIFAYFFLKERGITFRFIGMLIIALGAGLIGLDKIY